MNKKHFILAHEVARQRAIEAIESAPDDWLVRISPPNRTLEQNAKLHAIFSDISRQLSYHGRKLSSHQWKVLFISGHAIATGLETDLVPGLEGEFVNIRESSANMSISRMCSLIEYVTAYGAQNGVVWSDKWS